MRIAITGFLFVATAMLAACQTTPGTQAERSVLEMKADQTVQRFKNVDPTLNEHFFRTAIAWAVFPEVTKGAVGVGAAHGYGVLYQDGAIVGYCDLTQGSVGVQLGGQSYSEIIFFEETRQLPFTDRLQ